MRNQDIHYQNSGSNKALFIYTLCSKVSLSYFVGFRRMIWCEITNDVEENAAKNEAGVTREEDRTSVSVYFTLFHFGMH